MLLLGVALDWRVLGLLNLYRVLVPLVLLSLYSLGVRAASPSIRRGFSSASRSFIYVSACAAWFWCESAWQRRISKRFSKRRSISAV